MKISINRNELLSTLDIFMKGYSRGLPDNLKIIRIIVQSNLDLAYRNDSMYFNTYLDCKVTSGNSDVAYYVTLDDLHKVIQKYDSDQIIIETKESKLVVQQNKSKTSLNLREGEYSTYCNFHEKDLETDFKNFAETLSEMKYFAEASSSGRIELKNIYFSDMIVSTDGFHLAHKKNNTPMSEAVLVPLNPAKILSSILIKKEVRFYIQDSKLFLRSGNLYMMVLLSMIKYPDVSHIINVAENLSVTFVKEQLEKSVRRAKIMKENASFVMSIDTEKKQCAIFTEHSELGYTSTILDIDVVQNKLPNSVFTIVFDGNLILDAIKATKGCTLMCSFESEKRPTIVSSEIQDEAKYLIMPMLR